MALSQQQLNTRSNFIGSSEASIIASGNLDAWQDLIDEKNGDKERKFDKNTKLRMAAGSHLESFILDWFENDFDIPLRTRDILRHASPDYGLPIRSTLDALTKYYDPVEAKAHFGFRDIDELCEIYAPQCQHHLVSTGREQCFLVAFFAVHCRMEVRVINRDDNWINAYVDNCRKFWDWYQSGVPPIDHVSLPPVVYDDMVTIDMSSLEFFDQRMQSEMNLNAQLITEAKKAVEHADLSKTEIRHYMPDNCKRMTLDLTGNHPAGSKLVATRAKSGTISIRVNTPKEDNENV